MTLSESQRALRSATEMLIRRTDRDQLWASRELRDTQIADATLAVIEWAGVVASAAGVDLKETAA